MLNTKIEHNFVLTNKFNALQDKYHIEPNLSRVINCKNKKQAHKKINDNIKKPTRYCLLFPNYLNFQFNFYSKYFGNLGRSSLKNASTNTVKLYKIKYDKF